MFSFRYTNRMETKSKPKFKPDPKLKLMDQVRQVLRYHHYAYRTEQTYCDWIVRFIKYHGSQTHPFQTGKAHKVSASPQRMALNVNFVFDKFISLTRKMTFVK